MALKGLERFFPEDNEVWIAKQNLAIACNHLSDDESHAEAKRLMIEVSVHWNVTLGKNHPNTLLATFNKCRVLLRLDELQEAEQTLLPALKIASTRLGTKDFGYLSAKLILACIKLRQKNYVAAEELLVSINDTYAEVGILDDHIDRIVALWYLMECYKEQFRFDEALEVYEEEVADAIKGAMKFNTRVQHPLAKNLYLKRKELESLKENARLATLRALEGHLDEMNGS